ncbi:hypothetical protein Pcac1_g22364 [Phytophthora cactorum]|uniref:Uncharacterized protein n=1 Tax=Phytophthora cactorum TaxID=29920 RepID=A0A329SS43_9STRA|nr:hypothetical protein Pcac1_g22364 [Phytophthora cactorum]KAG2836612.1 hypothetical protein PC112_g5236 [Phytophthora cactorum]KAG2839404.1 hypothetical protein PC111_g3883 [Phytophthora cactorum]KAG2864065.1 hypothetical protein PC113_g4923 [Phytophthora cactorum]KAG2925582.1 hypothetical protein PC114_g4019 [Phytophthora cactorum]
MRVMSTWVGAKYRHSKNHQVISCASNTSSAFEIGQRNKKKSRQGPNADDSLQEVRDLVKWVKLYLEHKMQQGLQATGNSELPKLLFDELTGSSDLQADVWGLATVAHWRLNLSEVALFSFFFYFVFKREADV